MHTMRFKHGLEREGVHGMSPKRFELICLLAHCQSHLLHSEWLA
jgi:hypothetical protein